MEGWDEPTSEYPNGTHGNTSLFYEGKAARIGLSDVLPNGSRDDDIMTTDSLIMRLKQLITCAGLAVKDSGIPGQLDVCVDTSVSRKKRSTETGAVNVVKDFNRDDATSDIMSVGQFYLVHY